MCTPRAQSPAHHPRALPPPALPSHVPHPAPSPAHLLPARCEDTGEASLLLLSLTPPPPQPLNNSLAAAAAPAIPASPTYDGLLSTFSVIPCFEAFLLPAIAVPVDTPANSAAATIMPGLPVAGGAVSSSGSGNSGTGVGGSGGGGSGTAAPGSNSGSSNGSSVMLDYSAWRMRLQVGGARCHTSMLLPHICNRNPCP